MIQNLHTHLYPLNSFDHKGNILSGQNPIQFSLADPLPLFIVQVQHLMDTRFNFIRHQVGAAHRMIMFCHQNIIFLLDRHYPIIMSYHQPGHAKATPTQSRL